MAHIDLFSFGRVGSIDLRNRMFMAPMTRSRALPSAVPSELAIEYYGQRASAGLIITEGTAPSASGLGYARTPAIDTEEQIAGWRKITNAVHLRGGRIFLQLMHTGRIAHPANRLSPEPICAPSPIRAAGQIWTDSLGLQDLPEPRALTTTDVRRVVREYAAATRNGFAAGFDGVELHAGSGYLPMQFLSTGTNERTDQYGGSVLNRLRFVIEVLEAMIDAAGSPASVALKISPAMPFNDVQDENPLATYTELVKAIAPMNLAYLHVLRSAPLPNIFEIVRPLFPGPLAAVGGFDRESGNRALASGAADFIVYGKLFTSNPDLPERFAKGSPLANWDATTFYSPGPAGYIDFPSMT